MVDPILGSICCVLIIFLSKHYNFLKYTLSLLVSVISLKGTETKLIKVMYVEGCLDCITNTPSYFYRWC